MRIEHTAKGPTVVYEPGEKKFCDAVHRMEKRTHRVKAAAIVDPKDPTRWGRVVISYPADGAGRLYAVAWLPGAGHETVRHHGHASGGGYDKATAAMGGARYVDTAGRACVLADSGHDWRRQLEAAGYIVIQTV